VISLASALENVKIVDLTQHLAGPFCTMLLADMGAEVLKVEPPWGDASRSSPQYPKIEGHSSYFMAVNRNKKSIARIGYEALKEVNPGIVYASISGFGQDSPYAKRPSFDIIAQAMSGWMWTNSREPRGLNSQASLEPSCLAGSPGDTTPGMFCALSILAALHHRDATGKGQKIDVAQTDTLMTLSALGLIRTLYKDGTAEERAQRPSVRIHGVYEAKDGYVAIRVIGEKAVNAVAEATGIEAGEVIPSSETLKNWLKERSREEIAEVLAAKVPCAPVLTEEELFEDPNVKAREMIVEMDHTAGFTYRTIATGIKLSETPTKIDRLPPLLGADTIEVLREVGYDEAEIGRLIEEGAARSVED
jgi:crotonobetainyl-CoA:carnitine CoA-transferase CaiB-like acyl-CoA transferase